MSESNHEVERLERELAAAQADALAAETITVTGAAEVLACPAKDIEADLRSGRLVAFDHHGRKRLPVWQLSSADPPAPLSAVPDLARSFGGDVIALSAWASAPNSHLHGRTPAEVLRAGDEERVNAALAALGAAAF